MNTESPTFYTIRIAGILDSRWTDWFDGMQLTYPDSHSGETVLIGFLADQAALYGILAKIRDLNLRLIAIEPSDSEPPSTNHTDTLPPN